MMVVCLLLLPCWLNIVVARINFQLDADIELFKLSNKTRKDNKDFTLYNLRAGYSEEVISDRTESLHNTYKEINTLREDETTTTYKFTTSNEENTSSHKKYKQKNQITKIASYETTLDDSESMEEINIPLEYITENSNRTQEESTSRATNPTINEIEVTTERILYTTTDPNTITKKSLQSETPELQCVYRYPQEKHVNALLSNMMNQLVKIFSRIQLVQSQQESDGTKNARFRVVNYARTGNTDYFNKIYYNMIEEFKNSSKLIDQQVNYRIKKDPCNHQEKIRSMWIDLVQLSSTSLQNASFKCVEEFIKQQYKESARMNSNSQKLSNSQKSRGSQESRKSQELPESQESHYSQEKPQIHGSQKLRGTPKVQGAQELRYFLAGELSRLKPSQLHLLCDDFQMCYSDLLIARK